MKAFVVLSLALLASASAQAAFPEVYCVSTRSIGVVNQINVFTNSKGTMRISLQFWTTDGQNEGNFDSGILQTIARLNYDARTGLMSNGADKVQFQLGKDAISPKRAEAMFAKDKPVDLWNMPGHKIEFKKYYLGTMVDYNLRGRKGYWSEDLVKAFREGVTEYVCGKREDAIGARKNIFDDLSN